jgi:hypothetical protein
MRALQFLLALAVAAVLGFVSILCFALLFGECCGSSAWNSPTVSAATKASLWIGIVVPALAAVPVIYWGANDPEP